MVRRVCTLALACLLAGVLPAVFPLSASAREQTFSYPYASVWRTTVRMMRVDFASLITEKDRDDGYFLFEYEHAGQRHPGSVQVVRGREGEREVVRVQVQLPAMPSYVEQMMLDRLERKLGQEHGPPTVAKDPSTKASPKPDAPKRDHVDKADKGTAKDDSASGNRPKSGT